MQQYPSNQRQYTQYQSPMYAPPPPTYYPVFQQPYQVGKLKNSTMKTLAILCFCGFIACFCFVAVPVVNVFFAFVGICAFITGFVFLCLI